MRLWIFKQQCVAAIHLFIVDEASYEPRCEIKWRDKLHSFMLRHLQFLSLHCATMYTIHFALWQAKTCDSAFSVQCSVLSCNCRLFDTMQFVLIIILIVLVWSHKAHIQCMTTCYRVFANHTHYWKRQQFVIYTLNTTEHFTTNIRWLWVEVDFSTDNLVERSAIYEKLRCISVVTFSMANWWHLEIMSAATISRWFAFIKVICHAILSLIECNVPNKQVQRFSIVRSNIELFRQSYLCNELGLKLYRLLQKLIP